MQQPQPQPQPLPLLRLALERIASSRRSIAHLREVRRAEQVGPGNGKGVDVVWRWTARACFFPIGASRGNCLDLVIETVFAADASTPPTRWPYRVLSQEPVPGPPPFTDELLLLRR